MGRMLDEVEILYSGRIRPMAREEARETGALFYPLCGVNAAGVCW